MYYEAFSNAELDLNTALNKGSEFGKSVVGVFRLRFSQDRHAETIPCQMSPQKSEFNLQHIYIYRGAYICKKGMDQADLSYGSIKPSTGPARLCGNENWRMMYLRFWQHTGS